MANITTCGRCGGLYEAGSEEQANEPDRRCSTCIKDVGMSPFPALASLKGKEPRAMTVEEMREAFMDHIRHMVDYWAESPGIAEDPNPSVHSRLSGLAHSFLVALSGCSMGLPSFDLIPSPHPDDAEFHRKLGEKWWVPEDINPGGLGGLLYNTPSGRAWQMRNRLKNTYYSASQHRTFQEIHAAIEALPNDATEEQMVAICQKRGLSLLDYRRWVMCG